MQIIPILIIVVTLIIGILAVVKVLKARSIQGFSEASGKDYNMLLKQANKRLSQNPRDPEALAAVADNYFSQKNWDKAFKTYEILGALTSDNPKLDAFEIHRRYGLCALQLGQIDAAYQGFNAAWVLRQDNFEVAYTMGYLEFQQKNYEKAIQFLSLARKMDGEHVPALRYLGHAFFKLQKHKEAMAFIRKAIELAPDDKESLSILGECYLELGNQDQALKIFTSLRGDPLRGPQAALLAGTINMNQHQLDQAMEDFELGLKHKNMDPPLLMDLHYQLAMVSLKKHEIGKALGLLKALQKDNPQYKDVAGLIEQYEELNRNKNLQIFMLAPSADFVALCRKIVLSYYNKAKIKITNVAVNRNEWVDISADVETSKSTDMAVFRFIRAQGSIGELTVRDFHVRLKELKATKGICISVGTFSAEARRYTEARLIDLLEKEQLLPILITVDAKINRSSHLKT